METTVTKHHELTGATTQPRATLAATGIVDPLERLSLILMAWHMMVWRSMACRSMAWHGEQLNQRGMLVVVCDGGGDLAPEAAENKHVTYQRHRSQAHM